MPPDTRLESSHASSPPTRESAQIAAIRRGRMAVFDAARRGDTAAIEREIAPFVHAMLAADFSRQTICSLVAAAIDAGFPTGRGAARRARRAEALAHWVTLAGQLADEALRFD